MTVISTVEVVEQATKFLENSGWGEQTKITIISNEVGGWSYEILNCGSDFAVRFDNDSDVQTFQNQSDEEILEQIARISDAAQELAEIEEDNT